ncbi:unnamed protein product [Peniophora sp. CBMAI 1063]|nr:unnamed protein product [Peniophora sp. CBMAI 1063]
MAATFQPQDFPVGTKPVWELDTKLGKLESVLGSYVLAASLHESRIAWLSRLLPKSVSRGPDKEPTVDSPIPPHHSTERLSTCTLEVGPHTMPDLLVLKVTYVDCSASPTDPFSKLTPEIVPHFNAAAQRDSHLMHCVREAMAGKGTPDQNHYIASTIDQLAAADPSRQPSQPLLVPTLESSMSWDIIFQFKEHPNEQWILPRGSAFIEREPPDGAWVDLIQVSMPFCSPGLTTEMASGEPSSSNPPPQSDIATLRLLQPTPTLYDSLLDWVGGSHQNMKNRDALRSTLKKARARQFLQYRLPLNSKALKRFKAAAESPFPMKPLNPDSNTSGTRKRLQETPKKTISAGPTPKQKGPKTPATAKLKPKKQRTKSTPSTSALTTKPKHKMEVYVLMTRRRPPEAKPPGCQHCKVTGEPLHFGGRFCRPCIDAGHATPVPGVTHAPIPAPPVVKAPATLYTTTAYHSVAEQASPSSEIRPPKPSTSHTATR